MYRKKAFTLVELLVVIAIIGILISLLLPAVQSAREAARRMQCSNNLKQLSLALLTYESTYQKLPPGGFKAGNQLSWHARILPFIEQQSLYDMIDFEAHGYMPNKPLSAEHTVETFYCPSAPGERRRGWWQSALVDGEFAYTQHYNGVAGPIGTNPVTEDEYPMQTSSEFHSACSGSSDRRGFASGGVLYSDVAVRIADIRDGTSNTLAIGERIDGETSWLAGISSEWAWPCDTAAYKNMEYNINFCDEPQGCNQYGNSRSFGSEHPGGAMFAMCDGSVHFVSESTELSRLLAASSRAGGEVEQITQ